jgi:type VI secretion system protein ImpA
VPNGGDAEESGQLQVQSSQPVVRQEMTREAAFRAIEDIARYFERTEPQSPVHYALRNVVRWGRMPLPQLLAELIEDRNSMDSIRKLIGLPNENPDG